VVIIIRGLVVVKVLAVVALNYFVGRGRYGDIREGIGGISQAWLVSVICEAFAGTHTDGDSSCWFSSDVKGMSDE
jgi:hypothetical protein